MVSGPAGFLEKHCQLRPAFMVRRGRSSLAWLSHFDMAWYHIM